MMQRSILFDFFNDDTEGAPAIEASGQDPKILEGISFISDLVLRRIKTSFRCYCRIF